VQYDSVIREDLIKLAEQQKALIASIAAVKDMICAGEKRRRCLFILSGICETASTLRKSFPYFEKDLSEMSESLIAYVNFGFDSTEDLQALFRCLDIVAGNLEDGAKDAASEKDFRPYLDLPYKALKELRILDDGIPPEWTHIIDPDDKAKEAARKEARERIEEISIAWMRESLKLKDEQRKKELYG
jgi:hypothetical protein